MPNQDHRRFVLHCGDMTDASSLVRVIQMVQPDEIYEDHLAHGR